MDEAYHLVAASNKDSNRTGIRAFLDHEHLVASCAKRYFPNNTSGTKFFWCKIFESGDNAALGCDGDKLV